MPVSTFTIDDIMSWSPCAEYNRGMLVELLGEGVLSVQDILSLGISVQDRLWVIVRSQVVGNDGLAAIDNWSRERFDSISATGVCGENCKSQFPLSAPFQNATMLSELMRCETGNDSQFLGEFSLVLANL